MFWHLSRGRLILDGGDSWYQQEMKCTVCLTKRDLEKYGISNKKRNLRDAPVDGIPLINTELQKRTKERIEGEVQSMRGPKAYLN